MRIAKEKYLLKAIKNSTSLHEDQKQDRITVNRWIRICKDVAQPVLRIHEILERIRTRGSIPLTNGSGSCCFFVSDLQDVKKKLFFFSKFFCLFFFEETFT
jgi:hypothetical protein